METSDRDSPISPRTRYIYYIYFIFTRYGQLLELSSAKQHPKNCYNNIIAYIIQCLNRVAKQQPE